MSDDEAAQDLVRQGRAAMARADWEAAVADFTQALAAGETAEAHYLLGQALWFRNDLAASLAHHRSAYALYRAQGDPRAARIACWVGLEHGGLYGDHSVARGWFARAASLLEAIEPCPDLGYYLLLRAIFDADPPALAAAAGRARELARRHADPDLEAFALVMGGKASVSLGRVAEGMALLEEGMAAVLAGEVADPTVVADCFCFMLGACESSGDYSTAEQWVRTAAGYADEQRVPFVRVQCRATYAGILIASGRWDEAEAELLAALRLYDAGHRYLRTTTLIRLAELRIQQGAVAEAVDLLAGMEDAPAARLPLARVHLLRGEHEAALALLAAALPEAAPLLVGDAEVAALAIDAWLQVGDTARASSIADKLAALAEGSGSPVLGAEARYHQGRVAAAAGDADAAGRLLAEAAGLCPYPESPLAARIRLDQAKVSAATSPAAAVVQARAALAGFRRLEATRGIDEAVQLLRTLGSPTRVPSPSGAGLTRREQEVLALVAEGLSNPQIATRLYLSPKTVEHHVTHILTKLGVTSRAALAAYQARSGATGLQAQ